MLETATPKSRIKVADEVWIATALLHREHPEESDFSIEQIVERGTRQSSTPLRPGFYVHVVQHCVANRPSSPGRYRILFETAPGRRRLFRMGDSYHPEREGGKISPSPDDLPPRDAGLLIWYRNWCSVASKDARKADPLLLLRGSGKELWKGEHADSYVQRLREGWE